MAGGSCNGGVLLQRSCRWDSGSGSSRRAKFRSMHALRGGSRAMFSLFISFFVPSGLCYSERQRLLDALATRAPKVTPPVGSISEVATQFNYCQGAGKPVSTHCGAAPPWYLPSANSTLSNLLPPPLTSSILLNFPTSLGVPSSRCCPCCKIEGQYPPPCFTEFEHSYMEEHEAELDKGLAAIRSPSCFPHGKYIVAAG